MNASILKQRTEQENELWQFQDGNEVLRAWLDEEGFHCVRKGHAVQTLKWTDLIDKAEGQLKLPI